MNRLTSWISSSFRGETRPAAPALTLAPAPAPAPALSPGAAPIRSDDLVRVLELPQEELPRPFIVALSEAFVMPRSSFEYALVEATMAELSAIWKRLGQALLPHAAPTDDAVLRLKRSMPRDPEQAREAIIQAMLLRPVVGAARPTPVLISHLTLLQNAMHRLIEGELPDPAGVRELKKAIADVRASAVDPASPHIMPLATREADRVEPLLTAILAGSYRPAPPDDVPVVPAPPAPRVGAQVPLSKAQERALSLAKQHASQASPRQHAALLQIFEARGYTAEDLSRVLDFIAKEVPITINFDPGRLLEAHRSVGAKTRFELRSKAPEGAMLIDVLSAESSWRSEWETGVSAGSPSASWGGKRDHVEAHLFRDAYHDYAAGTAFDRSARPKYGALNVGRWDAGAAPFFGSACLVLKPEVLSRVTLLPRDSWSCGPDDIGTPELAEHVLYSRLRHLRPEEHFLEHLIAGSRGQSAGVRPELGWTTTKDFSGEVQTPECYLEAQLHGPIDFDHDVAAIVAKKGAPGSAQLAAFAEKHGIELRWHEAELERPTIIRDRVR